MKEYLEKLPKELQDLICLAGEIARKNNLAAYLVGGFVRDLILGVKNLDVDILVEKDGLRFAEGLATALGSRLIRHRQFQTATVVLSPQLKIDVATTRKETYPEPAHLPLVSPGSLKDDLKRRDFTINAMAMSINFQDAGRFIDYFDGRNDLRNRKIRILHTLSFIDDPTRILRAVRFEQRFNFRIEPHTLILIKEAVRIKMLQKVHPHRLRDELILILKEQDSIRCLRRIHKLVGFQFFTPFLSVRTTTWKLLCSIEREILWFKEKFSKERALDTWLMFLAGLSDTLSPSKLESICKKYAFRKGEIKRILTYKRMGPGLARKLSAPRLKPSKIFSLLEPLSCEAILLLRAKYKSKALKQNIADFLMKYSGRRLSISGSDLKALGIKPGPQFARLLTKTLAAKVDGKLKNKNEELAFVKKIIDKQ